MFRTPRSAATAVACWRNGLSALDWRFKTTKTPTKHGIQTMENVDFLPERIRLARTRRRRIIRQVYLSIACACALVVFGYARHGQIREARGELVMLDDRAHNVRQQLKTRQSLEDQQTELVVVRRIVNDLGSRTKVLNVLAELQRVIPPSIHLKKLLLVTVDKEVRINKANINRSMRVAIRRARKRPKAIKRVQLEITGVSPSDVAVANFIGQLSASEIFEDVNMLYARDLEFCDRQAREFKASCLIVR